MRLQVFPRIDAPRPARRLAAGWLGVLACGAFGCLVSLAGADDQYLSQQSQRLSNQASKRSVGSATTLDGVIVVYHVFVHGAESSWQLHERQQVQTRLQRAYDFLTRQCQLHGRGVTFVDELGQDVRLSVPVPTDAHADPQWTEQVLRASSQMAGRELVRKLRHEFRADSVTLCLHVNKAALSYNLAYYEAVDPTYIAERMICFSRYPDGRETSPATYAHEILHLFGAGDLYFPYDTDAGRKQQAARLFPDDIMLRVDYDMSRLNIGAFTAYRIGWLPQLHGPLTYFED